MLRGRDEEVNFVDFEVAHAMKIRFVGRSFDAEARSPKSRGTAIRRE